MTERGVCMFLAGRGLLRWGMSFLLVGAGIVAGGRGLRAWSSDAAAEAADSGQAGITRLEKDIPRLMKEAEVPGMAVVVLRDGKVRWAQNFGQKNAQRGQAVGAGRIFGAGWVGH